MKADWPEELAYETLSPQKLVDCALALAHAALIDATEEQVAEATRYAARVLPVLARATTRAMTLDEGQRLVVSVAQLRATLKLIEDSPRPLPNSRPQPARR